jgi:hypothetical protein
MALLADMKVAQSYAIAIQIKPADERLSGDLREYLETPIDLILGEVGLDRADPDQADVTIQIDGRVRWIRQDYGSTVHRVQVDNAGAHITGTTTIRSSNGRLTRNLWGKAEPPSEVRRFRGKLETSPEADRRAVRRANPSEPVVRLVAHVYGVVPLVRVYHQERRLQPSCAAAVLSLDRQSTTAALRALERIGSKEQRDSARELRRVVEAGRYRRADGFWVTPKR